MIGAYKQFDQQLHSEVDHIANEIVIQFLSDNGIYAIRNSDIYGQDILVFLGYKHNRFIEVEVKRSWKAHQDKFPWEFINLPERKEKFLRTRKDVEFWILREDMKAVVIIPGAAVKQAEKVEVSNKYTASGELFFKVPIDKCEIMYIILTGDVNATA